MSGAGQGPRTPPGTVRAAPGEQATVEESLLDDLLTATRALIAVTTRSLGPLAQDLSTAQYRTLVVLASHGPQRQVDLAAHLQVTASTIGRMCDRLARKGLVHRRRDRSDRRIVNVSLSRAGRDALDAATRRRRQVLTDMLAGLTPGQQRGAAAALQALTAAVNEVPDRDWPTQTR